MNVLYIVPYTPNMIRVRPYNLIRELSRRGNQVTVATLWTDEQELRDAENLSSIADRVEPVYMPRWRSYWNCLMALPTRTPLQAVYSWQPMLVDRIDGNSANGDSISQYDVVHVEHLRGSRYALKIKSLNSELPVIWDSVDCISLLFQLASDQSESRMSRWMTSFELSRNRHYEGKLVNEFDHTLVTSRKDREALVALSDSKSSHPPKVTVIPNGVDMDYFKPDENQAREADTLVVSGKMSYHANVAMVLNLVNNIMPRIWNSMPGVKLWVVGKDPTGEIRSLGKLPGVTVTGTVEDIRPYLRRAAVAVSPVMYGVGIQNKVLESMACRTPVVSTPQAVSTLDISPGKDILVAGDADEFATGVIQLLENNVYREEMGKAGFEYVVKNHKWSAVAEKLEGVYREAIHNKYQLRNVKEGKPYN